MVSEMKLQFEYEENPCSGLGDIVRKPLSQSDYITTQDMMLEPQYELWEAYNMCTLKIWSESAQ